MMYKSIVIAMLFLAPQSTHEAYYAMLTQGLITHEGFDECSRKSWPVDDADCLALAIGEIRTLDKWTRKERGFK